MKNTGFIGRKDEYRVLEKAYLSKQSQLVIVYGRRRVGKTFLINESFEGDFAFKTTGVYKQSKLTQLSNFTAALSKKDKQERDCFKDWPSAFRALEEYLDSLPVDKKQVVFFDEMPWLDTPKSGFLPAFEYFWNNYGNAKNNLLFIVAGSSSSWISKKLVDDKGGFFNRHSARIFLEPFTLKETKELFLEEGIHWSDYDIAECYMLMGGIPFYLNQIDPSYSLNENIDRIFFKEHGLLFDEFSRLYNTLFNGDAKYVRIVEALSKNRYGLSRDEISEKAKVPNNGKLSQMLQDLLDSGFIAKKVAIDERKKDIYRLSDFYTYFYFEFVKEYYGKDEHYWSSTNDLPKRRAYLGLTYELLCEAHLSQIKKALSIEGVSSTSYGWRKQDSEGEKGCQIDLVIDRRDKVASLLEIKFSINDFEIDKDYWENLVNKIDAFQKENPRKSIQLVLVTTYALKQNKYSNTINKVVTLKDLFA